MFFNKIDFVCLIVVLRDLRLKVASVNPTHTIWTLSASASSFTPDVC